MIDNISIFDSCNIHNIIYYIGILLYLLMKKTIAQSLTELKLNLGAFDYVKRLRITD